MKQSGVQVNSCMFNLYIQYCDTNISTTNHHSADLPLDHRYTSLEHTLIDVLIAAHAISFRAAAFSSLSELVWMFRSTGTFCHQQDTSFINVSTYTRSFISCQVLHCICCNSRKDNACIFSVYKCICTTYVELFFQVSRYTFDNFTCTSVGTCVCELRKLYVQCPQQLAVDFEKVINPITLGRLTNGKSRSFVFVSTFIV